MSDKNPKPVKPAKPPKLRAEDPEVDLKVKSPVPWMILAAVPLVILLVMALNSYKQPSPVEMALTTPSPKKAWAEELKKRQSEPYDPAIPRTARQEGRAVFVPGQPQTKDNVPPPQMQEFSCDFAPWVGQEVTPDILSSIEASKRPHRILPPGAMMTMDHSPARINFDIDENKKITRVWCG